MVCPTHEILIRQMPCSIHAAYIDMLEGDSDQIVMSAVMGTTHLVCCRCDCCNHPELSTMRTFSWALSDLDSLGEHSCEVGMYDADEAAAICMDIGPAQAGTEAMASEGPSKWERRPAVLHGEGLRKPLLVWPGV